MRLVAMCALVILLGLQESNSPPPMPSDATNLGSGTTLLDTSAAKAACVEDASLPGGYRMTCRWLYWRVYTRPTGRTSPLATQVCDNKCKGAKHNHPADCSEDGCYTACKSSHHVSLESQRGSERTVTVSKAVEKAIETCVEVGAELGFEKGPITAGISGSTSRSSTQTESIEKSIEAAISQSVTGSVEIELEHFNQECCSKTILVFGTYEYEVVLVVQALEQDYYCEDWVIGLGKAGVLPGSKLRATGYARYLGSPASVVVARYELPSNEPLSSRHEVVCKCKPGSVTTPSGTRNSTEPRNVHDEQSSLPKGTSRIIVTPDPSEEVVVHNPYNQPIIFSVAGIKTTVEPGQDKVISRSKEPSSVVIGTTAGVALLGMIVDSTNSLVNVKTGMPKTQPSKDCTLPEQVLKIGDTDIEWKAVPSPKADPKIEQPSTGLTKEICVGGLPVGSVPFVGGATPLLELAGNYPVGSTFELHGEGKPSVGATLVEIRKNGATRRAFTRFSGGPENGTLVVKDPKGAIIEQKPIQSLRPSFAMATDPVQGPAGSSATLTIDCRQIQALMEMDGIQARGNIKLNLDFSNSGGASGPKSVILPADGIAKVKVKRGSRPGAFEVGVSMEFTDKPKPLWK